MVEEIITTIVTRRAHKRVQIVANATEMIAQAIRKEDYKTAAEISTALNGIIKTWSKSDAGSA